MTSSPPSVRWYASESCSTRSICGLLRLKSDPNGKKVKSTTRAVSPPRTSSLRGRRLPDDGELHDERAAVVGQQARQLAEEVIELVASPVVERTVAARLLVGIDRHLVEARDDEVVALVRGPLVEVDVVPAHAVADAVAVRVRDSVGDRVPVDVDRMDVLRAVQRELHRLDPAAAADVEAAQPGAAPVSGTGASRPGSCRASARTRPTRSRAPAAAGETGRRRARRASARGRRGASATRSRAAGPRRAGGGGPA